ncbi:MAG: rhamnulokinase family protein [Oscillospiraceae bacterium]
MMYTVLAFDFGASSGRAIKAVYDGTSLTYNEVHRFDNVPIEKDGKLCWDFDDLMRNVNIGIDNAKPFDSVAFDTWGVDYGLLDQNGKLMRNPVHYRDVRTNGMVQKAQQAMTSKELYAETGVQIMDINTLFQLITEDLTGVKTILHMPDLFAYSLCGNAVCEESTAGTSQMLSPTAKAWSDKVLTAYKIPKSIFAPIVKSGTVIGKYENAKVISVAGHDTQCAIAAMPVQSENAAFLSCGTWSLLGCELDTPVLTEQSLELNLSNELGANGKINYLKNIIGLWLIQESRREWKRQGKEYSYGDLERLALDAKPLQYFIDPDAPEFAPPGDIPQRVQDYCLKTGQGAPQTVGEIMRCIYESLALKYCFALNQIKTATNKSFDVLHILGGGTKDRLLCQMAANALNIPVIAGPIEATALGNIIIQLTALGAIKDIANGRELIRKTEPVKTYNPCEVTAWKDAYEKYRRLL